jgi:hypothetical protein
MFSGFPEGIFREEEFILVNVEIEVSDESQYFSGCGIDFLICFLYEFVHGGKELGEILLYEFDDCGVCDLSEVEDFFNEGFEYFE